MWKSLGIQVSTPSEPRYSLLSCCDEKSQREVERWDGAAGGSLRRYITSTRGTDHGFFKKRKGMKTEAQLQNEERDALAKAKKMPYVPPSSMSVKFFELFNMSLPRVYELDWMDHHREFHVYPVLEDVAMRWFQAHPAAGVNDVCRI